MTAEHDKNRTAQHVDRLMARLKAAEMELDKLRADAARLDWLDSKGSTYGNPADETPEGVEWWINGQTNSLRDAIDAARAQADKCSCDQRGIGAQGVTCGDCPRDYGSKA